MYIYLRSLYVIFELKWSTYGIFICILQSKKDDRQETLTGEMFGESLPARHSSTTMKQAQHTVQEAKKGDGNEPLRFPSAIGCI